MIIDIENLAGSVREGVDPNGKTWRTKFSDVHYGELRGSLGVDGDKLDVYIRSSPRKNANRVYIVHQNFPRTHPTKGGQYDEDKVILGVNSADEAKALYLKHYNRKDFFRSITEMPIEAFKRYAMGENKGEKVAAGATPQGAKEIGKQIGINWTTSKFPVSQLKKGIDVEREHGNALGSEVDVGGDSDTVAARIAWAHLKEIPNYYTRLAKTEESAGKEKNAMEPNTYEPVDEELVTAALSALGADYTRMLRNGGKIPEGSSIMDITGRYKQSGCSTPGEKIRSKGKGRGLARGDGKGPLGVPVGAKEQGALANVGLKEAIAQIACATPGEKILSGGQGQGLARGGGKGPLGVPLGAKKQSAAPNVGLKEAYDFGVRLAAAVATKNPYPFNNPKAKHNVGSEIPVQSLKSKPLRLKKNLVAKI